jgi:hypothetical protein
MQRFGGAASTTIFLNESGPGCDKFCEVYGRVALPRDRCRSSHRFEIVVRHRIGALEGRCLQRPGAASSSAPGGHRPACLTAPTGALPPQN